MILSFDTITNIKLIFEFMRKVWSLGTLINHHNMKRINSRGMEQANKHTLIGSVQVS